MAEQTPARNSVKPGPEPKPDFSDVKYGPHERHVLDVWCPRGQAHSPAPLVVFIHGGGFYTGNKGHIGQTLLTTCLDTGYAVASINYRFSYHAHSPAFFYDGARAIQFLRHHARQWNIDPTRVAATGSSAGAGISLWIGFHDDLANPLSDDPIARQSTRLRCMLIFEGQCSYDPRFYAEHGLSAATLHPFITPFVGLPRDQFDTPEARRRFAEAAPINYVTPDDPPVLAIYTQADKPLPTPDAEIVPNDPPTPRDRITVPGHPLSGLAVHHPRIGFVLKRNLDALGIECTVMPGTPPESPQAARALRDFFKRHLEPVA